MFELAMDDRFIFAKNWGEAADSRKTADKSTVFWTIIDHRKKMVYGPFSEADFEAKVQELALAAPIEWKSVRRALKEACRDGRGNPS